MSCPLFLTSIYPKAWLLFLVEAAVSIFTVIAAWDDFGKGWGNFARLETFDWALFPLPGLSGLVASIVHFFFCWRIYKLTSMIALPTFIAGVRDLLASKYRITLKFT